MRLEAGSRLGPYEISGVIGAGGMGEVYRARDTRLGREVAIKILPHELSSDRDRLARFEREARSSSALNHPNIVTIHDFTSHDAEAWLVMELIRGESLRGLISRGALPLKKLLSISAGIADGLAAAHAAGIVHRDLKPENVMITGDGTPKILDFGLVKNFGMAEVTSSATEVHVSHSGTILGTAAYMSPEQARGEEVDFRSDQFSLGLILYEMATGKNPFRRPTPMGTLAAILKDDAPPLGAEFPEPFVWIVERCLAKTPAERYASTADLAYELRRLRDRGDRQVAPARATTKWWPLVASALAIVLAIGIALRRRPEKLAEPIETSIATPEIANVFLGEVAVPVALSPDGRYLLIYGADADDSSGLWLHDLRSGATRQIAQKTFSAAWSSDSKAIAYLAEGKLKTVPVEGGPARTVCNAPPEGTPAWHGDTILFAQYSKDPGIYRVNAAGGKPERLLGPDSSGLPWWPQFLPDGQHFLYLALLPNVDKGEFDHDLRIGSLDGVPAKKISSTIDSRAVYANGNLLFVRDGTLLAQPFDVDKARFTGEPKPIVDAVHYFRNTGQAAFSVSENGVLAWRAAARNSRLVWLDRSGIELRVIGSAGFQADGRLSPDGHRLAVGIVDPKQGVSDVWVYDLDRDSSERVTFRPLDEKAPVWAPDGRTIYYRSDGGGGPPDIFRWTSEAEGGKVYYHGPGLEEPQDVSPDGKWLLFVDQRQAGAADINVLPLSPSGPARPFVATRFNESSPRFSPDGHWVAYQSDVSGRPEVYVRPFEGSVVTTRLSKDGGTRPRWSGNGKELFYLAPGRRLMVVPISGGVSTAAPHMLFQAADAVDFEPAADGSRFLVQLEERSTEPPVHLLINWPSRLVAH
ncbi:MAG: serine/threonine-protein kinase [Acidobacteriota bacterium]|nr:serine/threonine-protein kinase [Acidobacteriota bacterium]